MEKLDGDAAAKFINALIKSVQTLCHGYLEFDSGIEIIGHLNLSVDKGSSLHYILEEKVCKNEENSTLFISNSFHAQNQKSDAKTKGKDSETQSGSRDEEKTSASDLSETGKLSAISSISSALSKSHDKNRSGSTSSAKDSENVHSKPTSSTAKRKSSDDHSNDVRAAKSSHLSSSPSPVSHFLSHSPHDPSGSSSPVDTKPSLRQLHGDDSGGTVLPQTAAVTSDNAGDLGVNLAGSVLERVDDQSNSDLQDRGEDSDGDLEVTFIKEEYVEGEQSACQFENSGGQQFGRGTHQRASSSDLSDGSMYPVSLHHSQSASSTFVPSAHDIAAAQHYGPSTSSGQPQPGTSGMRGHTGLRDPYLPASHELDLPTFFESHQSLGFSSTDHLPALASSVVQHVGGKKIFVCELCESTFTTNTGLRGHRDRVHLNKAAYRCQVCNKGFTMRGHYIGHMNMHNKVKSFKCSTCPRAFAHRTSLRTHLRTSSCGLEPANMKESGMSGSVGRQHHSADRKSSGPVLSGASDIADFASELDPCFSPFIPQHIASPGPRARTSRRLKVGTAAGHLCCDQCGATFASSRGLKLHRDYRHFNKAPYTCAICGRGFTMRGHYVGHMNMHNKIKEFKCSKCPKAFAHRSSLRYHLRNSNCGI